MACLRLQKYCQKLHRQREHQTPELWNNHHRVLDQHANLSPVAVPEIMKKSAKCPFCYLKVLERNHPTGA
jgi:hypothetical protein